MPELKRASVPDRFLWKGNGDIIPVRKTKRKQPQQNSRK